MCGVWRDSVCMCVCGMSNINQHTHKLREGPHLLAPYLSWYIIFKVP